MHLSPFISDFYNLFSCEIHGSKKYFEIDLQYYTQGKKERGVCNDAHKGKTVISVLDKELLYKVE